VSCEYNNCTMKNKDGQDLTNVLQQLIQFRDDRDWEQFHTPKDLALALSIEASELNELFLWKGREDKVDEDRLKEELADIVSFVLYLAHHYDLDLATIVKEKIEKNALKYPVEKSKGTATKYTEL